MADKVSSRKASPELRMGILLTACMALFIVLLFVRGTLGRSWHSQAVRVAFNNVSALRKEAPVRYNGLEIGRVKEIDLARLDDAVLAKFPPLTKQFLSNLPLNSQETASLLALPDGQMDGRARELLRGRTMALVTLNVQFENGAERFRADDEYHISSTFMGDSAVEIHTGGGEEIAPGTGRIFLGASGDLFSDIGKSFSQVKDILSSLTELAGGETTRQGVQDKFVNFETFTERIESAASSMETKLPETWDNMDRRLNATQTMFEDLKAKTEKMKPNLEQSLQKAENSILEIRRDTSEEVQAARKKIAAFRESALEKIAAWQKLSSSCRESIPAQVKSGRDWTDRFGPTAAKLDNLLSNADEQLNQGGESTRTMLRDLGAFAGDFEETTFRIKRWPGAFSHPPEKEMAEAHDLVWRRELACRQYVELRGELERTWNELRNSDKADRERLEWVEQILREADNAFEPDSYFDKKQSKRSK